MIKILSSNDGNIMLFNIHTQWEVLFSTYGVNRPYSFPSHFLIQYIHERESNAPTV